MLEEYNEILTVPELAEILRVGNTQAYRILKKGSVKAYKEGKDWKIPKEAVKQYIISRASL